MTQEANLRSWRRLKKTFPLLPWGLLIVIEGIGAHAIRSAKLYWQSLRRLVALDVKEYQRRLVELF